MKIEKWFSAMLLACLMTAFLAAGAPKTADSQSKIRIGTYDSRFVALAFYRAENGKSMREFLGNLNLELQKAREA